MSQPWPRDSNETASDQPGAVQSRMNERFNGKVTIVTGAASGIGRAVAERFFKEGASVFAVDRNPETLAKLPAAAERWHPHFCDVAAKAGQLLLSRLAWPGSAVSTCLPTL